MPDPKVLRYLESDDYLQRSLRMTQGYARVYIQPMFELKEDHEICSCIDPFAAAADWDWEETSTAYDWFADLAERYATVTL